MTKGRMTAARQSFGRKPRTPFADLAAALAQRSNDTGAGASTPRAFAFPAHIETDEWGFDTVTGGAAFDVGEDRLVRRPPGRPRKAR
jgi:hypothetical protein